LKGSNVFLDYYRTLNKTKALNNFKADLWIISFLFDQIYLVLLHGVIILNNNELF
jgi:hypothetical protein